MTRSTWPAYIFLGTLLVGLVIQGTVWRHGTLLDEQLWVTAATLLQESPAALREHPSYGYPGTSLLLSTLAVHAGTDIPIARALRGSIALSNALAAASIAIVCYRLRPASLWWLAAAGMTLCNRLVLSATPPSIVVAPLIVLAALLALYWYEHPLSRRAPYLLAVVLGISAATRLDITVFTAVPLAALLWPRVPLRALARASLVAVAVFIGLNPFMWTTPMQHLADVTAKVRWHYQELESLRLGVGHLATTASFALISMGLAAASLWRTRVPLPRRFIMVLLSATAALTLLILNSRYQALWYFYPFILLWEVLLPLLLLAAAAELQFAGHARGLPRQVTPAFIVLLLVGGHATMLLHLYFLPEVIFIVYPSPHL